MIARLKDERGVTIIFVAILMLLFLGITALAVDGGYLFVVHNELQNAADAGALAGARVLYLEDGTAVNAGANQIAYDAARQNKALAETGGAIAVDVNWTNGTNGVDVERGHWSFATHTFTPNPSLVAVPLWGVPSEQLDADTDFINAVRVVARRQATPAATFFARIFGYKDFKMSAVAIGYLGFAGTLEPGEVNLPIAICLQSISDPTTGYNCNIGRMINSGQNVTTNETGGWTSFNQDDPCTGGTNAQEVRNLMSPNCTGGNPNQLLAGEAVATNGGEIQTAFNQLISCWEEETGRVVPWNVTLPVVDCTGNNIGTCANVVGAVNLNIVWITQAGTDPNYTQVPTKMGSDWTAPEDNTDAQAGFEIWQDFAKHFKLQNVDGSQAPYDNMSIYFLPDCSPHELTGKSGGVNTGIMAKIPVLVK